MTNMNRLAKMQCLKMQKFSSFRFPAARYQNVQQTARENCLFDIKKGEGINILSHAIQFICGNCLILVVHEKNCMKNVGFESVRLAAGGKCLEVRH